MRKTFGAIEAPTEELDHILGHQERRKCASGAENDLARREPVAAHYLVDIRLPVHRVLEPARIAGPARQGRPFESMDVSQ